MTDTPQAIKPETVEPMPSSNNVEAPQSQVAAAQPEETPKEVSAETTDAETTSEEVELPEGVSERTRQQFEKLRTQLREERTNRLKNQTVFEQLRPAQQPLTQAQIDSYVDPVTGNVDVNGLNQAISSAQTRAANAEQTVQRWIEDQQTQEAHKAHPELNPNRKEFDPVLHKKTRALLMDSMLNPGDYNGKPLTYKQAGDLAKGVTLQVIADAEKVGAQKAIESLTPKEQASLEAVGRSDRRTQVEGLDTLRQRTRKGDVSAIMERLKNIPPVGR